MARRKARRTRHLKYRAANRELVGRIKRERGCEMCGRHPRSLQALHFHHKDPKSKRFLIGSGFHAHPRIFQAEVNKCQVLCASCHQKLHHPEL